MQSTGFGVNATGLLVFLILDSCDHFAWPFMMLRLVSLPSLAQLMWFFL